MATSDTNVLPFSDALSLPLSTLDRVERVEHSQILFAAGAVKALGDIVFNRYANDDLEGLEDRDMEGIGMAIMSLGSHLENLCGDLERETADLKKEILELPGAGVRQGEAES